MVKAIFIENILLFRIFSGILRSFFDVHLKYNLVKLGQNYVRMIFLNDASKMSVNDCKALYRMYEHGSASTYANKALSLRYLMKVADLGDPDSMMEVSSKLQMGEFFYQASRLSNVESMSTKLLASIMQSDNGAVEQAVNEDTAELLIHQAAIAGNPNAMFKLIYSYRSISQYCQVPEIVRKMKYIGELGHEEAHCRYALMCKAGWVSNEERAFMFQSINSRANRNQPMAMVTL